MKKHVKIATYDDFRDFMVSDLANSTFPIPDNENFCTAINNILNGPAHNIPRTPPTPGQIILCCLDPYERLISEYYAAQLTSQVVVLDSFSALIEHLGTAYSDSYFIFMPSSFFSLKNIHDIHTIISSKPRTPCIGFFPCGNADLLLYMVVKDLCYNLVDYEDKLSLLRILNKKVPTYSELSNLTIYNQESASIENVGEYFKTHFCKAASFLGHGRDDLFWLSNYNVICGRNDYSLIDAGLDHQPSCSYCGECFEPGSKRLMARELFIENLFLFSCNSAKPATSMFSKNYTILYGFLFGYARSVIGTLTTAQGIEPLNMYYLRLLECGFSTGEIVGILNMVNKNYTISHAWNFILIGNPGITVGNVSNLLEIEYDFKTQSKVNISINSPGISIIRVRLHSFTDNDFNCYLNYSRFIITDNAFSNKFYKIFGRDDDGWYLDLFACEDIPPMAFCLSIISTDFSILSSNSFFKQMSDYNLRLSNTADRLNTDLQNKIKKMHKNYRGINSSFANDETILYAQILRLKENMAQQSRVSLEALVMRAHTTGFRWEEFCYENGYQIDNSDPLRFCICPVCGGQAFYAKYAHPHYTQYARSNLYCGECGIVFDAPYSHECDISLSIEKLSCTCNTANPISITLQSHTESCAPCVVGFSVLWGEAYNFAYTNNLQQVNFDSNGNAKILGTVIVGPDTPPHSHPLKIYVLLNGQLYGYRYNLWLKNSR